MGEEEVDEEQADAAQVEREGDVGRGDVAGLVAGLALSATVAHAGGRKVQLIEAVLGLEAAEV